MPVTVAPQAWPDGIICKGTSPVDARLVCGGGLSIVERHPVAIGFAHRAEAIEEARVVAQHHFREGEDDGGLHLAVHVNING